MSSRSDSGVPPARADQEAASWLVRRDGGFTPKEEDEFLRWLAADPRHGEALDRQRRTWEGFDRLRELRGVGEPNPDLFRRPRRPVRWVWAGALAAAAGVALTLALWHPWSPSGAAALASGATGEHRVLADGSVVDLNPGSALEVQYRPDERRVRLVSGEASFKVARDASRPFVVHANGVAIRAVGTAFDVKLDRDEVEVLVTEGQVRVDPPPAGAPPAATLLAAGHRMILSLTRPAPPPQVIEVSTAEMPAPPPDRPVVLEFSSTRLGDVVAEFNRRNRVQLVIADPELRALPIVASFRSDNVEGFVRLLELTAGVRAERADDTITLRRSR